jgi:hypothetical protein
MGSGSWSTDVYKAQDTYRRKAGVSAFAYSDNGATTTHADLNPKGVKVRESRDSAEHPNALPIAIMLDVTGSMASIPRELQRRLPALFGLLLRRGYALDPQILFGAIGDAFTDSAPLQVGQFESDNRTDADLGKLYLEGNGGGQKSESYELGAYFLARHTALDAAEKHGRRGFCFFIGDEQAYLQVRKDQVRALIGDELTESLSTKAIFEELKTKFDVYYIMPEGASHSGDRQVIDSWRALVGQNIIMLADLDAVCETIALTIGLGEGTVDLAQGINDLADVGSNAGAVVGKALSGLPAKVASAPVASA